MKNILLILNFEEELIKKFESILHSKFSEIFAFKIKDFLKINSERNDFFEKLKEIDFMILFNENSLKDKKKLYDIEEFLTQFDLFPKQIIIFTNKKNHEPIISSKFEYIYELILKPFNESLFNAKINSVLRKYFLVKKIKDNLEILAIQTNYFLLSGKSLKKTLLIGSDKKNLNKLSEIFLKESHDVKIAHFENIYQNFLKDYPNSFDLVILNDFDNIHHLILIFNQLKAHEDLRESIIIFLIKNTDAIFLADIINLGIDAYFFWPTKNFQALINLINFEMKNKEYYDFLNKEFQNAFESAAFDETTKVFSKKYLINFLEKISKNGILKKDLGFIFMDLNDFKGINDEYGHLAGDFLLVEIAKILKKEFKEKIVSRFGGDEFVILIDRPDLINSDDLEKMIKNIKKIIENKNFYFDGKILRNISISSGFSIGKKEESFLKSLEIANKKLYKSKKIEKKIL